MFACICHAVSEDDIAGAVALGADTVLSVGHSTRAGTGCGTCHDHIAEIIERCCGACPLAALQPA